MSLGGYADERDDVGKFGWRGDLVGFWGVFGHAVQILLLLCGWSTLTGLTPGAGLAKPTYPPYISSFKV